MNTESTILRRALAGEALTDELIIDIHVHSGKWMDVYIPAASEERIVEKMDRTGVSKSCINGILHPDVVVGNDRVAAAVKRYPDHLIGFAALNPYHARPMIDEIKRCVEELGMKGLKVHQLVAYPQYTVTPIDAMLPEWVQVWEYFSDRDMPVLFHGVVTEEVIARFPDIPFVMAHGLNVEFRAHAHPEIASPATFRRWAAHENLHVETASTQNLWWYMDEAAAVLGPERVLWGTDAPLDDFAQRLGVVLDSNLSEDEQLMVLGGNAARLMKL